MERKNCKASTNTMAVRVVVCRPSRRQVNKQESFLTMGLFYHAKKTREWAGRHRTSSWESTQIHVLAEMYRSEPPQHEKHLRLSENKVARYSCTMTVLGLVNLSDPAYSQLVSVVVSFTMWLQSIASEETFVNNGIRKLQTQQLGMMTDDLVNHK